MNGKLIRLSIIGMTGYNEYDALGDLFRRRLENHRIPVNGNGWIDIEHRLNKRKKNKAAIWLWSAAAAAASIALLLIFNHPASDETVILAVEQQATLEDMETANLEARPNLIADEMLEIQIPSSINHPVRNEMLAEQNISTTHSIPSGIQPLYDELPPENLIAAMENDEEPKTDEDNFAATQVSKEIPKLNISLLDDWPEDDETGTKNTNKWLFAAAFGTGGYINEYGNGNDHNIIGHNSSPKGWLGLSSGNSYATDMSYNIRSFSGMSRNDFTNISHRPPFSIGLTARKSLSKNSGVESGLVYTYLASQYKWSNYDVRQGLHYVGIPVNGVIYLWNSNPNWRVYFSGGFMIEKGLRGIYRQERWLESEHRITTVKSSSISGMQWSLNGALGINYRLEKGWGIYFEPRVGYSFDCDQPVSIRTEWPVYVGVHLGLNYEL